MPVAGGGGGEDAGTLMHFHPPPPPDAAFLTVSTAAKHSAGSDWLGGHLRDHLESIAASTT